LGPGRGVGSEIEVGVGGGGLVGGDGLVGGQMAQRGGGQ